MSLNDYEMAEIGYSAQALVNICHEQAVKSGWWRDIHTGEDLHGKKNVPTLLMLIVSEIAEAMEGDRKNLMDEHLPAFKSIEVELADAVIRIFDMAGGMHLNVSGAMLSKLAYNAERADHKPENRAKENGKQY